MAKYGEMNKWGYFPVEPESQVAVGADIGFAGDNSVAITVERLRLPVPIEQGGVGTDLRQRLGDPYLYVRGIVIFPLRTPFDYVINHLKKIQVTLDNKVELLVDCT